MPVPSDVREAVTRGQVHAFPPRPAALPAGLAAELSDEGCAAIEGLRPGTRRVAAGASLFEEGDAVGSVHVLLDGWAVRTRTLKDGRRQIVGFALPGALIGLGACDIAAHGLEARTDCVFAAVPRAQFEALLGRVPALARAAIAMLARGEAMALERLVAVGRLTARERIAHLLLELATRARRPAAGGERDVALPLRQIDLADALGLTSVHVCRTLQRMRRDGLIAFADGRLRVPSMARLRAEAGFEPDGALPWRPGPASEPAARRVLA